MSIRTATEHTDDQLSLFNILDFLLNNSIILGSTTIIGLVFAGLYLMMVPSVYEATLQIEMARISVDGNGNTARGAPVEDAQLLVERLRLPSTYTDNLASACNLNNAQYPSKALADRVRSKVIKGVQSVVEITVPGDSPAAAQACTLAIFEMIRHQQNVLLEPYVSDARENKTRLEARLKDNQEFLSQMDQTSVQSAVYLAKRDESMWLMNQIADIERALRQTFATKLVSPIYSTPQPVSPKTTPTLVLGTLAGLVLGFILVILRKVIIEWRRRPAEEETPQQQ